MIRDVWSGSPPGASVSVMASLFTRIIDGEIPGRFVWSDETCVAFLTLDPRTPGHAMVVPRVEVDQWVDLDADAAAHVFDVAGHLGRAQRAEFGAERIGVLVEGYEVHHTHVHVWPSHSPEDFRATSGGVPDADLDDAARRLRSRLRAHGHPETPEENV